DRGPSRKCSPAARTLPAPDGGRHGSGTAVRPRGSPRRTRCAGVPSSRDGARSLRPRRGSPGFPREAAFARGSVLRSGRGGSRRGARDHRRGGHFLAADPRRRRFRLGERGVVAGRARGRERSGAAARRGHSLSSGRQCRSGACRRSLPLPSPTAAGRGRGRRFRAPALRVGSGRPARRGGYVVIKPWHFDPERILRGRDIVCFSNDWDGDPLSKTHIMKILARDNRVLWVNSLGNRRPDLSARDLERIGKKIADIARGLREEWPNLHVLGPIALPAFGTMARTVNRIVFRQQVLLAM